MESSRRDILISFVAFLIVVTVLVLTFTITDGSKLMNQQTRGISESSSTFFESQETSTERPDENENVEKEIQSQKLGRSMISAEGLLNKYPLIDGHNDFPYSVRQQLSNDVSRLHMDCDLASLEPWASDDTSHTDLGRLGRGQVGGQFWSAYIGCEESHAGPLRMFIEQIDVIKQMLSRYPGHLQYADCEAGVRAAWASGKIASLIGVEGGHAIEDSLAALRLLYQLGVR